MWYNCLYSMSYIHQLFYECGLEILLLKGTKYKNGLKNMYEDSDILSDRH